jgi:hypothetical protein
MNEHEAWIVVHVPPARAAEVNRALAEGGIYASAVQSGSDLESVFLAVTAVAPPPLTAGPPAGWGQAGAGGAPT